MYKITLFANKFDSKTKSINNRVSLYEKVCGPYRTVMTARYETPPINTARPIYDAIIKTIFWFFLCLIRIARYRFKYADCATRPIIKRIARTKNDMSPHWSARYLNMRIPSIETTV